MALLRRHGRVTNGIDESISAASSACDTGALICNLSQRYMFTLTYACVRDAKGRSKELWQLNVCGRQHARAFGYHDEWI
jgi:hypothetical protein